MDNEKVNKIISRIENEIDNAYDGVDEYANSLEDTLVITNHLDTISNLLNQLKEMI